MDIPSVTISRLFLTTVLLASLLPASVFAETRYEAETGKLIIEKLVVDNQNVHYGAVLLNQGSFFSVDSLSTFGGGSLGLDPGIFNSTTGTLSLPELKFGGKKFQVKLRLSGGNFVLDFAEEASYLQQEWWQATRVGGFEHEFYTDLFYRVDLNSGVLADDGSALITGSAIFNETDGFDVFLSNVSQGGTVNWSRKLPGTAYADRVTKSFKLENGNILIAGSEATETWSSSYPERNPAVHLMEIDQDANVVWQQSISVDSSGNTLLDISQAADGGFFLLSKPSSFNSKKTYVIKVDSFGETEWATPYQPQNFSDSLKLTAIASRNEGGFITFGTFQPSSSFVANAVFSTYDDQGIVLSQHTYPRSSVEEPLLQVNGVEVSGDGNFLITGRQNGQAMVAKMDGNGQLIWNAFIHAPDPTNTKSVTINRLLETDNGQILVVGNNHARFLSNFDLDGSLAKIDQDGTVLWQKVISNDIEDDNEYFQDLLDLGEGRYLIIGNYVTSELTAAGNEYSPQRGYLSIIKE